jgi:hypothetical protein
MRRTKATVADEGGADAVEEVDPSAIGGRGGEGGGEGVFLTPPRSLFLTGTGTVAETD